jgi:hypothetical protein
MEKKKKLIPSVNDIGSISEIKVGTTKLPAKDKSVTVLYLDNKMEMPSIITDDALTNSKEKIRIIERKGVS